MSKTIKGCGVAPQKLIIACKNYGLEFPYDKKNYDEDDYVKFIPKGPQYKQENPALNIPTKLTIFNMHWQPVKDTLLFTKDKVVEPHDDIFLGIEKPGFELSFFWMLDGDGFFKIDGEPAFTAKTGDWFVFEHTKEHMLFSKKQFLVMSCQLQ